MRPNEAPVAAAAGPDSRRLSDRPATRGQTPGLHFYHYFWYHQIWWYQEQW
jgi:hypothetical protein